MDFDFFVANIENRFNVEYTEEQRELMRDITKPTLVFADPGTGKTETIVKALLCAEMVHRINPKNIFALSFTNQATVELKNRHERDCKRLGIGSHVSFKTLDKMCADIIKENAEVLSTADWEIDKMTVAEPQSVEDAAEFLIDVAAENDITINPNNVRNVVFAIRSLNSALVFDRLHMESKLVFKKAGLSYEDFQLLRKSMYMNNKILKRVRVDDISLYALEILIKKPEVGLKLKKQNRIIAVDEFQDMSIIKLKFLSMITDCLVVIGDIKQQIYAFNGACSEIVDMYRKYYPDRKEVQLTKSFRCPKSVAEYSTGLILPNKMGGENFTGRETEEGCVHFYSDYDLDELCRKLKDDFVENRNVFTESMMFLYRNNYSAVPIVEKLYQYRIPVLVSRHLEAHKIPVIRDLCGMVELIRNPKTPNMVEILNTVVPEFRKFRGRPLSNPINQIMRKEGLGFFDVDYNFKDRNCQELLYTCLKEAKAAFDRNALCKDIFNELYPYYRAYVLRERERYMEQPAKYYVSLVSPMTAVKTYNQFIGDELAKQEFVDKSADMGIGIRCLTFHAAKGTEADIVHILDADEGIIPNARKLEETLRYGCVIDAARDIRSERSLVYVACTRTKSELNIHHKNELSSLFMAVNNYVNLDVTYETYKPVHNDVEVFTEFFK